MKRVLELLDEFQDLGAPVRAKVLLTSAVALADAFCVMHTERRATEDEFVLLARDTYKKTRELVPLVKPTPPGVN